MDANFPLIDLDSIATDESSAIGREALSSDSALQELERALSKPDNLDYARINESSDCESGLQAEEPQSRLLGSSLADLWTSQENSKDNIDQRSSENNFSAERLHTKAAIPLRASVTLDHGSGRSFWTRSASLEVNALQVRVESEGDPQSSTLPLSEIYSIFSANTSDYLVILLRCMDHKSRVAIVGKNNTSQAIQLMERHQRICMLRSVPWLRDNSRMEQIMRFITNHMQYIELGVAPSFVIEARSSIEVETKEAIILDSASADQQVPSESSNPEYLLESDFVRSVNSQINTDQTFSADRPGRTKHNEDRSIIEIEDSIRLRSEMIEEMRERSWNANLSKEEVEMLGSYSQLIGLNFHSD